MSGSSSTTRMRWLTAAVSRASVIGGLQHPEAGVVAAPVGGALAFEAVALLVREGVEERREGAPFGVPRPADPVEDVLRDGGVAHDLGLAQHLEVPGDGGLRELEDG